MGEIVDDSDVKQRGLFLANFVLLIFGSLVLITFFKLSRSKTGLSHRMKET